MQAAGMTLQHVENGQACLQHLLGLPGMLSVLELQAWCYGLL